jgi:TolA-binding protein
MIKRTLQALLVSMLLASAGAYAQEGLRFQPGNEALFRASDGLSLKLYSLAADAARTQLRKAGAQGLPELRGPELRLQYIEIVGRLRADRPGALEQAKSFLPQLTAGPLRERLSLAIARYLFLKERLPEAIPYYEAAGIENLDNVEIADAKFELAYAYFNSRQFAAANSLFAVMKEVPGKYYSPGNYYFGLLAYNEGDFAGALRAFERIAAEPVYQPIVPYYIAEIYYFMGNREKALSEALRLIQQPEKLYYDNELHLLVAQCLFEAGRYGDALPYFEHYYGNTDKIRKEELYEMGYAYYRVSEWKSAIEKFKPLSAAQDSLGQTAMYLLGDCYLKTRDKSSARNAFGICSSMPFNAAQREASLLLYAKLSYELGFSDDAMRSIRSLLREFPNGKYASEGRVLQGQLYLETNNYKDAWEALREGASGLQEYKQLRQRAAYGYAIQELQRQHLSEASELLSDAVAYEGAPRYTEAAYFWKAELAYRQRQYDTARRYAQAYLDYKVPANSGPALAANINREQASMILGYAALQLKDYSGAEAGFKGAHGSTGATAGGVPSEEAKLRLADSKYMQKDFAGAAPLYAEIAAGRGPNADYARLQAAIIAGLRGDDAVQYRYLQEIIALQPGSPYAEEARYELGAAQLGDSKYADAVATLKPLTERSGTFTARALLKTGSAQQQLDQDDAALTTYGKLVKEFRNAPERNDALAAMKSIYIERNQPDAYATLLRDSGLPAATDEELEGTYYNAAEAQYASEKWAEAQTAFSRYLQQYPSGTNASKARFYLANSLYNLRRYKDARAAYDTVLNLGPGAFNEESTQKAAELAMADSAYEQAATYYQQLASSASTDAVRSLAYTGLMRSAARMEDAGAAARYADTVLLQTDIPQSTRDEARIHIARRAMNAGRQADADAAFRELQESPNGLVGAEARYYLAKGLMDGGKLKDAETAASKNIRQSAGYEYWVVRTYILLGDILTREKDFFNARATLQSVAQHATIPALREEAKRKLDELKAVENSKLSND